MSELINSAQNRYLKLFRSLGRRKARKETGLMPLEGKRLVSDAIDCGYTPEFVLMRQGEDPQAHPYLEKLSKRVPVYVVSQALFEQTAFTETPQGIMAIFQRPIVTLDDVLSRQPALILVSDGLQDPGNMGTMLRSAVAAGATGAILLPGTVDVASPKVIRSAMGANFRLPIVEVETDVCLDALQKHDITLITASGSARCAYDIVDWNRPLAVAIGNEGAGLSPAVEAAANTAVSIPMCGGTESLNAAVAMSVIFFEASRQRRFHTT